MLQYSDFDMELDEFNRMFKNSNLPKSSDAKKESEQSSSNYTDNSSSSSKITFDGYLFFDPDNTVRKKAARLLEKFSEAFPQEIYTSIIELMEKDYKATIWYKK